MQITKKIIVPAKDIAFITNYEARVQLNLASSTDENVDDLVEMLINWCSDEISVQCQRVFAQESLIETFREVNWNVKRLYMSHVPIKSVDSIVDGTTLGPLVEDVDFEVDNDGGSITRLGGVWSDPVVITYTGGSDLPFEAPPALKKAALLLTREAYYAAIRGDASIRMISHKEARVIYFDPRLQPGMSSAGRGGSAASRAIADLIEAFTQFEI